MNINLFLMLGGGSAVPTIQITTPAYLDPAKMRVGDVIGSAFTAGVYPDFQGNPVQEVSVAYTVDGGPVLSTYVLAAGDVVGQAEITLTAGVATRDYFSGIEGVTDFSFVPTDLDWVVPPGAAVPDQFAAGGWSVTDKGTNGDADITITTLPADNGSAITDLEYRIDAGAWTSLAGTTTGTYAVSGFTDGTAADVTVRAVNAGGGGPASAAKSVTTTGIPAAFTSGQWNVTDLASGGDARIAISALPSANGSAITALERKVGAGAWTSLGGTTTGNYDIAGFTDGVATNVLIRAVNAKGNGPDSDTKSVTTSADTTAPTLSSPTDAANGSTAATGSVSTSEGNGTLYWVVSTSGTAPTKAQVKAGQDHTGSAAADAGSQAVSATGVQTLSPAPSGLTASTAYTIHFMHEDAAANQSTVASGDGFTTVASGITGHDAPQKVIDTSADQSTPYTGTITGVAAGDRLYAAVMVLASDNTGTGANPASWTVTVNGGSALTADDQVAASQLYNGLALYSLDAPATGDLTLSVTPSGNARGCAAWAWKIQGHNTGTPHPSAPDAVHNESAVTTIVHPNTLSVADGDVVLGVVGIKGGDVTGLGVTGADGSTVDETGTTGFTDTEHGVCWKKQSGAGTVTFDWDWTSADGVVAGYWRIQKA